MTESHSVALPSFDIAGQVVLVTGASSGIGRHFAGLLAAAGAKVAAMARRTDRLGELARDIEGRGGICLPLAGDVTKQDSVKSTIAAAEAQLGPLSILINNAGVVVSKPLFEHTEEDWDYVVDTNLKGAWLAARDGGDLGAGGREQLGEMPADAARRARHQRHLPGNVEARQIYH